MFVAGIAHKTVSHNTVKPECLEHRWLFYHGWFELVFESLRNSSDSSRKQIFWKKILVLSENCMLCVVIRIALSKRFLCIHSTNNYWVKNRKKKKKKKKKKKSLTYRYLFPDLAPWLALSSLNCPCLEQFSMVPKMYVPVKFYCILFCDMIVLYWPSGLETTIYY